VEVLESVLLPITARIYEQNWQVLSTKLGKNLKTETTRSRWRIGLRDNGHSLQSFGSRGDGRTQGHPLGAHGGPEAPVLDVASSEDAAVSGEHGSTHQKATVGRVSAAAGRLGSFDQWIPIHRKSIYHAAKIAVLGCLIATIGRCSCVHPHLNPEEYPGREQELSKGDPSVGRTGDQLV